MSFAFRFSLFYHRTWYFILNRTFHWAHVAIVNRRYSQTTETKDDSCRTAIEHDLIDLLASISMCSNEHNDCSLMFVFDSVTVTCYHDEMWLDDKNSSNERTCRCVIDIDIRTTSIDFYTDLFLVRTHERNWNHETKFIMNKYCFVRLLFACRFVHT
jgi:hypothetical protein